MNSQIEGDGLAAKALERIEAMEAPGYVFPERFGRVDWILAVAVIAGMVAWIVAGLWL